MHKNFTLKNINVSKINAKYDFSKDNDMSSLLYNTTHKSKTTKISELNKGTENVSFLDESKKQYMCNISMIDFVSHKYVRKSNYHCFWDRHPFDTEPIGCPIKYISHDATKIYKSNINKEIYIIKENLTSKKYNDLYKFLENTENTGEIIENIDEKKSNYNYKKGKAINVKKDNLSDNESEYDENDVSDSDIVERLLYEDKDSNTNESKNIKNNTSVTNCSYYITDGVFCSFNCVMAYINEHKHVKLYEKSKILLLKLYNDFMNSNLLTINPSPHWRYLDVYGGHLTISKFREGLNKYKYENHGESYQLPEFISIRQFYEERIKI